MATIAKWLPQFAITAAYAAAIASFSKHFWPKSGVGKRFAALFVYEGNVLLKHDF
jgi:hypothetical protein